ncbi:MAG: hypothetical protein ACI8QD_000133 [Cyclobacteriaceae bacterium]|jgi:hypothetical protein
MRKLVLALILSIPLSAFAQPVSGQPRVIQLSFPEIEQYQAKERITAVVVRGVEASLNYLINQQGDSLLIPVDHESPAFTYFISLPQEYQFGNVYSSDPLSELFLLSSGVTPLIPSRPQNRVDYDRCSELPPVVSQSQWRLGLAAPNYSRSFHEVRHLIIHHSAGSNSADNFVQVVRDIYLFHTEVNGWSDIGYNYLIAQDGTLFAGRDPGTGQQGLVRGAHFCGANSNTMGICVLGNYETTNPGEVALQTLENFLNYQTLTLKLNPISSSRHSTGELAVIASHQDGCATLCPGINLYNQLSTIRQTTLASNSICVGEQHLDFSIERLLIGVNADLKLTNTSKGYLSYSWLIDGIAYPSNETSFSFNKPGTVDVGIVGMTTEEADTLMRSDAVRISLLKQQPIIFPNPIENHLFTLDYKEAIERVVISDLIGKQLLAIDGADALIKLPQSITPGTYLLSMVTVSGKRLAQRLIIR